MFTRSTSRSYLIGYSEQCISDEIKLFIMIYYIERYVVMIGWIYKK